MMKMKKLSAALLAVVMLVSMLSCMVLGVSAVAVEELGGPVSIKKVSLPSSGIQVGGKSLPGNILVVNSDWVDNMGGDRVQIELGGGVYTATFGANAFADIGAAVAVADSGDTIYVAAGVYTKSVSLSAISYLKIYGPWAGTNPNDPGNVANPNTARPAADIEDFEAVAAAHDVYNEAVVYSTFSVTAVQYQTDDHLEIAGLYFAETAYLNLPNGSSYRIGTRLHNNIFSVTSSYIMALERGQNPGILFENNRVLAGKSIVTIGGMMDCTLRGNYLNLSPLPRNDAGMTSGLSAGAVYVSSVQNPSSGSYVLVENNHFANCSGIFRYDRGASGYQTVNYSVQIKNNTIARVEPGTYLIWNKFYAEHSLPGINVQFTGNEVYGIPADTALFSLPYFASEFNLSRYRYMININQNFFDLPVDGTLVNSEMAGVVNVAYNTYTNGISIDQVIHADDCEVILYPYNTAEGTVGEAKVQSVRDINYGGETYVGTLDEDSKLITYDLQSADLDTIDLSYVLQLDEGCTFKVYEESTLETEVKDKILYFDGYETERYIVVSTPDGGAFSTYRFYVTREYGQEAELLKVIPNSDLVTVSHPETFRYVLDLNKDVAFLTYDLKVSAGATVTLWADHAKGEALADLGDYIPYGTYRVEVFIESEDKSASNLYVLEFNREKSDLYDPSIIDVVSPEGAWNIRPNRAGEGLWMNYYCNGLLTEATFDLKTTPGATYKICSDAAATKVLSASGDLKALPLVPGINTFYIQVKEGNDVNVIPFEVVNETLSSDAAITGISGNTTAIVNNEISMIIGGDSTSVTFTTRDPYAVCEVYADEGRKLEVEGTSMKVEDPITGRVTDTRSFSLATVHTTSKYFVKCIAEDGKTYELYTLYLNKTPSATEYADVDDEWYASYVETASTAGMIAGQPSGDAQIFRPNDNTTREEMATIISRLIGINGAAYESVTLKYKDAAKISDWALGYVKVCYYNGLMGGSAEADGTYFFPAKTITREEVMAIFARMFKLTGSYDLSTFKDANKVSSWAKTSVEAVVASGLIMGDNGMLKPTSPITRAEIATIVTRALDYAG